MKNLSILLLIFSFVLPATAPAQHKAIYTGITKDKFNYVSSSQRNSQWCWAASIQMIFNYYGVAISQEQVVSKSYGKDGSGQLPNRSANEEIITANLNNWKIGNDGQNYMIEAKLNRGPPTPSYLIEELVNERPVLIGYRTGPTAGHTVLITACSYYPTANGPVIRSIIVRDPWPSEENLKTAGRIEYSGISLANLIQSHWYVKVISPSVK